MAYTEKFIDRSPKIAPAGISNYQKGESVKRTLVDLNTDYSDYAIKEPKLQTYPQPPIIGDQYAGFFTKMRELIQSDKKSFFQNLVGEFKETRYKSYWNQRLGRCRDYIPGLPHTIDPETHCFGNPTPSLITAGELISPKKTAEQIIHESEIGHEMHVKTHHDYDAAEQINRNYDNPPINKDSVWGRRYPHSKSGQCVKDIMIWNSTQHMGKRQNNFQERYYSKLGKPLNPNNNVENVPRGHRFGIVTKDENQITVGDTMKSCSLSATKHNMMEALEIINSLRTKLSKRSPVFPYLDFLSTFRYRDKNNTGCVDFESAYEILALFNIIISKKVFDFICTMMEIRSDNDNNIINYIALLDVLCPNLAFPKLKKIQDLPDELLLYKSEYQDEYDTENKEKGVKADCLTESFVSGNTDVRLVVVPSVYTQYGVTYNDFFKVLNKTQVARLFKNIDIEIPDDKFEMIWELSSKKNEYSKVCLYSFTEVLKEVMPEVKIAF